MTVQNAPLETSAPQPASPLQIWSPGTIAAITIVAGYPVGVLFATGNWYRLGLRQKAHGHLLASAWLSVGLGALGIGLPTTAIGYPLGILVMTGLAAYLTGQMQSDLAQYSTPMRPISATDGALGFVLGLGIGLLYLGSLLIILTFTPLLLIGAVLMLVTLVVGAISLAIESTHRPTIID